MTSNTEKKLEQNIVVHALWEANGRKEFRLVSLASRDDPEAKRTDLKRFVVENDLPSFLLNHPHYRDNPKPHLDIDEELWPSIMPLLANPVPMNDPRGLWDGKRKSSFPHARPSSRDVKPIQHDRPTQRLLGDEVFASIDRARARTEAARRCIHSILERKKKSDEVGALSSLCDAIESMTEGLLKLKFEMRGAPAGATCETCDVRSRAGEAGWCEWGCRYLKDGPCIKWKEKVK